MSVSDIFKPNGAGGHCIAGRIESGLLCVGDKVLVCPLREQAQVKNISLNEINAKTAFAGDQVAVTLTGIDVSNVVIGAVLSDIHNMVPITNRFRVRIVVFNLKLPLTMGYPVLMHHLSMAEPAIICKLKAQLHKSTGEVLKKNPRCLANNTCAIVDIQTTRPVCIETYENIKEMGRIMLRVDGVTIAAGFITDILK